MQAKAFRMRNNRYLVLLLAATVLVCLPMCTPYATMVDMQDMLFHMNRIEGIKDGLLAGQFPVRIHAYQMDGYGYAAGIFYPDFFLYVPALLRLLGVPMGIAYNGFMIGIHFLTAIFAYMAFTLFFRSYTKGALAAALYVTCGYRMFDVLVRGDVGEVIAMAFLPLALFSIYDVLFQSPHRWWLIVLSYTGILQSHLLTSLFCILFAFTMIGFQLIRREAVPWRELLCAIGITLFLNAWFYLPFFDFYQHVDINIRHAFHPIQEEGFLGMHLVSFLFNWQAGLMIGMVLCAYYCHKREMSAPLKRWWYAGLAIPIMVTCYFPWDMLSQIPILGNFVNVMQFPWRLLEFGSIPFVVLATQGISTWAEQKSAKESTAVVLLYAVVFLGLQLYGAHFWPAAQVYDAPLRSDYNALGSCYDYLPAGYDDRIAKQMPGILQTTAETSDVRKSGTTVDFGYESEEANEVVIALVDYPGYRAVDEQGTGLDLRGDIWHRLVVSLPAGQHRVHISYEEKSGYLMADGISVLTLFGLAGYFYRRRKAIQEDWRNMDRVS